MRSMWTTFFAAVFITGCGNIGERPDEAGMSLTYYSGSTGLPGVQGALRAAMGRGLGAEGCIYREWGEFRVQSRVVLVARGCEVLVEED